MPHVVTEERLAAVAEEVAAVGVVKGVEGGERVDVASSAVPRELWSDETVAETEPLAAWLG